MGSKHLTMSRPYKGMNAGESGGFEDKEAAELIRKGWAKETPVPGATGVQALSQQVEADRLMSAAQTKLEQEVAAHEATRKQHAADLADLRDGIEAHRTSGDQLEAARVKAEARCIELYAELDKQAKEASELQMELEAELEAVEEKATALQTERDEALAKLKLLEVSKPA